VDKRVTIIKMRGMPIWILVLLAGLVIPGLALSDTLVLNDGQQIQGKFKGRTADAVRFEVGGQVREFKNSNIQSMELGPSLSPAGEPVGMSQSPAGARAVTAQKTFEREVSLPAGTRIMVRTDADVDSGRHGTGRRFTSKLETDLVRQDAVVAPRGSIVYGRLVEAKSSGSPAGGSEMTITFTDILINNQMKPLSVFQIKSVSDSRARRTAAATSETTVVRDGSGRPYGITIPGKAGAALPVPTRGNQINIPAGTLLEFQLAAPLTP